jgi:hypothetical protein
MARQWPDSKDERDTATSTVECSRSSPDKETPNRPAAPTVFDKPTSRLTTTAPAIKAIFAPDTQGAALTPARPQPRPNASNQKSATKPPCSTAVDDDPKSRPRFTTPAHPGNQPAAPALARRHLAAHLYLPTATTISLLQAHTPSTLMSFVTHAGQHGEAHPGSSAAQTTACAPTQSAPPTSSEGEAQSYNPHLSRAQKEAHPRVGGAGGAKPALPRGLGREPQKTRRAGCVCAFRRHTPPIPRVPGEGFEPPKLSRLIYSQLPLATRATWLGFADPWWRPWAELYITRGGGLQPVSLRVASAGLADRCAEVQDSWRTRRSTW